MRGKGKRVILILQYCKVTKIHSCVGEEGEGLEERSETAWSKNATGLGLTQENWYPVGQNVSTYTGHYGFFLLALRRNGGIISKMKSLDNLQHFVSNDSIIGT